MGSTRKCNLKNHSSMNTTETDSLKIIVADDYRFAKAA